VNQRLLRLRVAVVALALLLAACSGPPNPLPHQGAASPRPSGAVQGGARTAASPGTIDAFVPTAVRFVESHRGLRFKQPVKVDHLADQDFQQRIIDLQRRERADTDREARLLRALRLVDPLVDVEKAEEQLLGAGVVGYYDPKTKELVVRGDTASPSVRHVVVHELTHALQDQWFGLDDGRRAQTDDGALAYTALVEGDAVRVEREYIGALPSAEKRQLAGEGSGGPPAGVPRVLIELLEFPYVAGPPFIRAVLGGQGQQGLDRAFKDRPAATSQILNPDRFLQGQQPQAVPEPAADAPPFDRGVLGEAQLTVLLESAVRSGSLTAQQAQAATDGWAGDRYIAWASGDSYCLRDRFAGRTPADAAALTSALQKLVTASSGATVEPGPQPVLTTCG
jgi:hypothetical protein